MSFPPLPTTSTISRSRSTSSPSQPSFGAGPKWISTVLPTPPDSDTSEAGEAAPLKRPTRHFAAFDLGFIPLTGGCSDTQTTKLERCYEELDEEPVLPPTPCVKLKDGRELRPLLKHRKRSLSHHVPSSARWDTTLSPSRSTASLGSLNKEPEQPAEAEKEQCHPECHPHVHFSEALENVCVFDEAAPAHDSDPTNSPLEPPRPRAPPSPRTRTMSRQLRLPGTVISSPTHRAALGFDTSEPTTPISPSPLGHGRDMHLKLAYDSALPSPENAPNHGMITTLSVRLSPEGDNLAGLVRVRNVGFEKHVCVIYTVDDWTTRREANARWTDQAHDGDVPPRPDGYDDFEFHVPLADLGIDSSAGTAVRAKILRFAVRYQVPGQGEWWDNRDGANWVARFRAVSAELWA